jgi:hypothetical protein
MVISASRSKNVRDFCPNLTFTQIACIGRDLYVALEESARAKCSLHGELLLVYTVPTGLPEAVLR